MKLHSLNLDQHPYYNKESLAYSSLDPKLKPFYEHAPRVEDIKSVIEAKQKFFGTDQRTLLHDVLQKQYADLGLSADSEVLNNITSLLNPNTFTVTTGQQIHIFFGPLFFIYKALSAIGTAAKLNEEYPDKHFVPIFWMASEDHDFEEINSIEIYGKNIIWEAKSGNAVGRMSPKELTMHCDELLQILDDNEANASVVELFKKAYAESSSFATATQKVLYSLSRQTGLVVLEPDDVELKSSIKALIKNDLIEGINEQVLNEQTKELKQAGFKPQIGAQAQNFFYFSDNVRVKIQKEGDNFVIGKQKLSANELAQLIETQPGQFSPNVALRPLYQESILPNVVYIAGTSELRYWLQLKAIFKANNLPMPMVLIRNSFLMVGSKLFAKAENKLECLEDLFLDEASIAKKYDQQVQRDLHKAQTLLSEGQDQLEAIKLQLEKLPLNRLPHGGYKSVEKGLNQIANALNEVDTSSESISELAQQVIQLKQKIANSEQVQERTTALAAHFPRVKELLKLRNVHAFQNLLHILEH